jgi:Beta-lactamase enzyme family
MCLVRFSWPGVTLRVAVRLGAGLASVAIAITACGQAAPAHRDTPARRDTPTRSGVSRSPAPTPAATAKPPQASGGICTSATYPRLAAQISAGIKAALAGRVSLVGLAVDDPALGLTCRLNQRWHDDAASVAKVMILGALLHELAAEGRQLSPEQSELAEEMITQSDDTAASDLWGEVGPAAMQNFLNLAGMTQTTLGPGIYWGLTQVDAHDEMRLLRLLVTPNTVLNPAARDYELKLMADVTPSQRWGVPAGAPADVTVHVKNGWLPDPDLWVINSIGDFTSHDGDTSIVILTEENPSMPYGIDTVQGAAEAINRGLRQR